jgi:hypothetical protein
MKGNAPNSPATGSHVRVRQNEKPNLRTDSIESFTSTTRMPRTTAMTRTATAPVPARNSGSAQPARRRPVGEGAIPIGP